MVTGQKTKLNEEWAKKRLTRFVDRLSFTDCLNVVAFAGGAYATYFGLNAAAGLSENIPDWFKWLSPLSPFAYQLVVPIEVAKNLSEVDKVVLALLGGYSTVKLVPLAIQGLSEAGSSLLPVG